MADDFLWYSKFSIEDQHQWTVNWQEPPTLELANGEIFEPWEVINNQWDNFTVTVTDSVTDSISSDIVWVAPETSNTFLTNDSITSSSITTTTTTDNINLYMNGSSTLTWNDSS